MASLAVAFPKARLSLEYLETEGTALALALKAPHAVLMGSYWDTYVFTALQGDTAMVPCTLEDSFTRTPWTKETARRARCGDSCLPEKLSWRPCVASTDVEAVWQELRAGDLTGTRAETTRSRYTCAARR